MNNPDFKIFGDKELLKDCKINLKLGFQKYKDGKYDDIYLYKTILNKGEIKEFPYEDYDYIDIYVSKNDSLVSVLRFENIMRNANDYINHLYLKKEHNLIKILYVGRESGIKNEQGIHKILIPLEDFYKQENIKKNEEKEITKKLFFNNY